MIRSVIFDFGRVISAPKPEALFRGYETELGLEAGSINEIMFSSEAWRDALVGRKTMMEFWMAVGPRLGLHTLQQIEDFHLRYHADERVNGRVLDYIRRLSGKYRLAVCSNWPSGLRQWLEEWNIDTLFDVVFCSGDEGVAKPDPKAYLMTVQRLGVTPWESIFVDDACENVEAASRLGLRTIHFTDAQALEKSLDEILSSPA